MRLAARRLAGTLGVLGAVVGCGEDTTAPPSLSGLWVLTSYGGAPPPLPIATTITIGRDGAANVRCDVFLESMVLETAPMTATLRERRIAECEDGSTNHTSSFVVGSYRLEGDRLVVELPGADDVAPSTRLHATVDGTRIVVTRREYLLGETINLVDETQLVFAATDAALRRLR